MMRLVKTLIEMLDSPRGYCNEFDCVRRFINPVIGEIDRERGQTGIKIFARPIRNCYVEPA